MKVEAHTVGEFMDKLKALIDVISETVRSGDDGFEENIHEQVESINTAIDTFKLERLTPVTKFPPRHLKYEAILESLDKKEDKTASEAIQLYCANFYFTLKRLVDDKLSEYGSLSQLTYSEVKNLDLFNHIESLVPESSVYHKLMYSQEFYFTSMRVIQELVDDITEQRARAPQQQLFT